MQGLPPQRTGRHSRHRNGHRQGRGRGPRHRKKQTQFDADTQRQTDTRSITDSRLDKYPPQSVFTMRATVGGFDRPAQFLPSFHSGVSSSPVRERDLSWNPGPPCASASLSEISWLSDRSDFFVRSGLSEFSAWWLPSFCAGVSGSGLDSSVEVGLGVGQTEDAVLTSPDSSTTGSSVPWHLITEILVPKRLELDDGETVISTSIPEKARTAGTPEQVDGASTSSTLSDGGGISCLKKKSDFSVRSEQSEFSVWSLPSFCAGVSNSGPNLLEEVSLEAGQSEVSVPTSPVLDGSGSSVPLHWDSEILEPKHQALEVTHANVGEAMVSVIVLDDDESVSSTSLPKKARTAGTTDSVDGPATHATHTTLSNGGGTSWPRDRSDFFSRSGRSEFSAWWLPSFCAGVLGSCPDLSVGVGLGVGQPEDAVLTSPDSGGAGSSAAWHLNIESLVAKRQVSEVTRANVGDATASVIWLDDDETVSSASLPKKATTAGTAEGVDGAATSATIQTSRTNSVGSLVVAENSEKRCSALAGRKLEFSLEQRLRLQLKIARARKLATLHDAPNDGQAPWKCAKTASDTRVELGGSGPLDIEPTVVHDAEPVVSSETSVSAVRSSSGRQLRLQQGDLSLEVQPSTDLQKRPTSPEIVCRNSAKNAGVLGTSEKPCAALGGRELVFSLEQRLRLQSKIARAGKRTHVEGASNDGDPRAMLGGSVSSDTLSPSPRVASNMGARERQKALLAAQLAYQEERLALLRRLAAAKSERSVVPSRQSNVRASASVKQDTTRANPVDSSQAEKSEVAAAELPRKRSSKGRVVEDYILLESSDEEEPASFKRARMLWQRRLHEDSRRARKELRMEEKVQRKAEKQLAKAQRKADKAARKAAEAEVAARLAGKRSREMGIRRVT